MTTLHEGYAISDVAERTGLSVHTLRYYERAGLMPRPIGRSSSTHRRYSEGDVSWVVFLTRLRSTGMPIATLREYTELAQRGDDTAEARLELLLRHRISFLARLEEMQQSLEVIDRKIELYTEQVATR
ncbi:MerR family transcriptional regulator [Plantibacter sp. MCCC 1A11337]|jgi:DNA-binding transcriptional MerR regulator|uniref:DNA-binding transcriptional regulator, MerR family n=1 Tax=Plantibacter elymi (nom. nud.) TaxID=199708 RepID=A0ABY1RCN6_9MICO|nr:MULTISPECIES: MerR family transcriptional regulator [Plantibacter]AQX82137.1 MerR family transcriptional regulator [Plantibacter flavus]KQQ53199.1 MerR family transcriptional regulator [Plantibacter sp. Leaf314]MBD8515597.1 MerR family transcriptional regulator [Plantibacter sp. CFBP 8804]NUJ86634.1 MerR family transcriptional regulator [Plantibacter sp. MCCC 1A11337]SMQ66836.1 DNA-binding transcriptional regulator, MerR family [Plantibacter sp. VKM Ac-1784]